MDMEFFPQFQVQENADNLGLLFQTSWDKERTGQRAKYNYGPAQSVSLWLTVASEH